LARDSCQGLRRHVAAGPSLAADTALGPGALDAPSPKQWAWLCVQPQPTLAPTEAAALARIEQDAEAARVVALARRFCELVREQGVTHGAEPTTSCTTFEQWLAEARTCGVRAVETFAQGLAPEGDAIRAALTTP
jgi:hypothetical protein